MNLEHNPSFIIYLTGRPGMGKYTIAKALEAYGFILCDNQLVNNPIFALLKYDGFSEIPPFAWEAISRIRDVVFEFMCHEHVHSYVLTNNLYEDAGDRKLYEQVKHVAKIRGSIFVPVRLELSQDEHLKRVTTPSRRERWKSIDPKDVFDETPLLNIEDNHLLTLDVSHLSPEDAAQKILAYAKRVGEGNTASP